MEKNQEIADKIKNVFQNGFILDGKILHYIDSTYSNPSKAELENILTGDSDAGKETLLKLLFTPDESIHFLFEGFLEDADIGQDEVEEIAEFLSAQEIESEIIFPDERGALKVSVPEAVLSEFVAHLNMQVKFNDRLAEAFKFIVSDRLRALAKVKIRNARGGFAGTKLDFLALFFEKMGSENEIVFAECLDAAIGILEDVNGRSDVYQALQREKASGFQSLVNAERFEEQLEKSNIETLLLQGVRPVSVDKDAAMRKMEIIDRICLAVFGKTEYYEDNFSCIILNGREK